MDLGKCVKCSKKITQNRPGIVCSVCRSTYHGDCVVPPLSGHDIERIGRTTRVWMCHSCKRERERDAARATQDITEYKEMIRKKVIIHDVRDILIAAEKALDELTDRYFSLIELVKNLKNENVMLKKRITMMEQGETLKAEFVTSLLDKKKPHLHHHIHHLHNIRRLHEMGRGIRPDDFQKKDEDAHYTKDFDTFAEHSGLSKTEKMAIIAHGKIGAWSKAWVTHILLVVILLGYTALGAAVFSKVEKPDSPPDPPSDFPESKKNATEFFVKALSTLETTHGFGSDDERIFFDNHLSSIIIQYENDIRGRMDFNDKLDRGLEEINWSFWSSFFFASTVYTTIGYGHMSPTTRLGQGICIAYALAGVPLFLTVMADLGQMFTRGLKYIYIGSIRAYNTKCCKKLRRVHSDEELSMRRGPGESQTNVTTDPMKLKYEELDENFSLPISVAAGVSFFYLVLGGVLFMWWEEWSFFISFYFTFQSITTIGYGDLVPKNRQYMTCWMIFLLFGLVIAAMSLNVVREKITETFAKASAKVGAHFEQYVDELQEHLKKEEDDDDLFNWPKKKGEAASSSNVKRK